MSSHIDASARYQKTHEWSRREGDLIVIGISDHAQEAMSDLVYVELPTAGQVFKVGDTFGVVESVKAASDIYAPVAGEVVEVNEAVASAPELINKEPYQGGWIIKLRPANTADFDALMTSDSYEQFLSEEESH